MPERSLRALARQYAKGEMNRETYLRSRAEFIEAVLSGSARLPVNEYPAPRSIARAEVAAESKRSRARNRPQVQPDDAAEADDVTSVMITDPTPKNVVAVAEREPQDIEPDFELRQPQFPMRYVGIAAIACVAVALVILAATRSGAPKPQASPPEAAGTEAAASAPAETPAPEPVAPSGGPGVDLIQQFLADRNWSDDARSGFVTQWQALSEDDRSAAMNSGEMAQLNNAIYKKLLEERALSGLGDAPTAIAKQRALVEFAETIGLHDPRLTLPATTSR